MSSPGFTSDMPRTFETAYLQEFSISLPLNTRSSNCSFAGYENIIAQQKSAESDIYLVLNSLNTTIVSTSKTLISKNTE